MKKYLLGMTAIVLAIGFSAFTTPASKAKTFDSYELFSYTGPATATQAQVQNLANYTWVRQMGSEDAICDQGNLKPCEIAVNTLDTSPKGLTARQFDLSKVHSITATAGSGTPFVVASISATNTLPVMTQE